MASLLLRSAGQSLLLQRPIPRAALEVTPRRLMGRRLYSSDGVGTSNPQTDMVSRLLQRAQQDLTEEYKALEEGMISRMDKLKRRLDELEGRMDRQGAVLNEREVQYQKYDKWSLGVIFLVATSQVSLLVKKTLYG